MTLILTASGMTFDKIL